MKRALIIIGAVFAAAFAANITVGAVDAHRCLTGFHRGFTAVR